jgi:2-polyprenyl-3-methyl-5-hydroxy-6-metoxy-1,4-benzoquinol methylase
MNKNNTINKSKLKKEDVADFLKNTNLQNYQSIELPFNLRTPGLDRGASADIIFKYSVENKTVLDIGCKYGYFCHEAVLKGALSVTGVEINKDNVEISKKIISMWNRDIEIIEGDFLKTRLDQKFDIVLFLNVIHHVISPVEILKKISKCTNELMIVEFPTILDKHTGLNGVQNIIYRLLFSKYPLAYIGSEQYHRAWYFSRSAFKNLLISQLSLFRRIEFVDSPRKKGRVIAFCWK